MEEKKTPFYKKKPFWITLVVLGVFGAFIGEDETDSDEVTTEEVTEVDEAEEVTEDSETEETDEVTEEVEEAEEPETTLPEEIEGLHVSEVRDDTTGNWYKAVDSRNFNMPENAVAYYNEYMEEGQVHYLVSFATNTTTMISDVGGILYINITEYEDKEEHSANTIGGGMLLKSYNVVPESGEIEEIE